jgi:glucosamine kinase
MTDGTFFLGFDGGGTGCRARLADASGRTLGEGSGGSANLTLGYDTAVPALQAAAAEALARAGLPDLPASRIHAGFGLAGANVLKLADGIRTAPLGYATQSVESDAYVACLGAHGGEDGAILILGTGSQGLLLQDGKASTLGGWGFALSDEGSGAILGRAALRAAILAHDGLAPRSGLTDALLEAFGHDPAAAVLWARSATPRDYGAHAPTVVAHADRGDPVALSLLGEATAMVAGMLDRLVVLGARRIALMGGLAGVYRGRLPERLDTVLADPRGDALDGALLLARRGSGQ